MKNIKWEKYEEYQAQQEQKHHALDRFREKIEASVREVELKKAEYQALIVREVGEGSDLSKQKEQTKQAELKAVAAVQQAQEDLTAATRAQAELFEGITQDELFDDWQNVLVPQVQREITGPIEESFKQARALYLDALLKAYELIDPLDRFWKKHASEGILHNFRRNGAYRVASGFFNFNSLPHIKGADLDYVQMRKKLPDQDAAVLKEMEEKEDAANEN